MLYTEYLECAKKHVMGCAQMLAAYSEKGAENMNVWLELYYLSGYIIEACTVYSVYKLGGWADTMSVDVHDPSFVTSMNVDFYGKDRNTGTWHHPVYPYRGPGVVPPFAIKSHEFQPIINSVLRANPSLNTVPYLGTCDPADIDSDIVSLLDNWNVRVRYEHPSGTSIILTKDIISRLYKTCLDIVIGVSTKV